MGSANSWGTTSLAREVPDARVQLLVARVGVDGGGQGGYVTGKPLRQEEVPTGPVDVRDRRVAQGVEGVETIESSLHLPGPEGKLDPALADADAGLGAEEGIAGLQTFPTSRLVTPKLPELTHERIRQENVARSAPLRDFGADSEARAGGPIIYIDIPDV